MKILYSEEEVAHIHFPAGLPKDGGTCEFATETCLKNCPQERNKLLCETLRFFEKHTVEYITETIREQISELGCILLYWFWSGDCPSRLTVKVNQVQKQLSLADVTQIGFTRNIELWRLSQSIPNIRIVLTIESEDRVESLAEEGRLVGVPDYTKETVRIYLDGTYHAICGDGWLGCGSHWLEECGEVYEAICSKCYKAMRGCFTDLSLVAVS